MVNCRTPYCFARYCPPWCFARRCQGIDQLPQLQAQPSLSRCASCTRTRGEMIRSAKRPAASCHERADAIKQDQVVRVENQSFIVNSPTSRAQLCETQTRLQPHSSQIIRQPWCKPGRPSTDTGPLRQRLAELSESSLARVTDQIALA